MVPPLLKLEFVQGPRDGDSLQYKPGSTIRIGRIVRGNEIAIKDAGISTKHLRIVSDSDNWVIHELGSSNGTIINSVALEPDSPVDLRHGDVIKLGECTSIVVSFETDVPPPQEHKLPPRPKARRNTTRVAVSDPDPDPIPVESVQEKPKRRGRSSKQEEQLEPPKRTRATRSRTLEDIVDSEKEVEIADEKKEVKARVGRPRKKEKKVEITNEEEKKGNSMTRRGKNNTEIVEDLGLKSIKLEVEDSPKVAEIPAVKRAVRGKKIGDARLGLRNVKSEDTTMEEDDRRASRAASTRSKKNEIGGDAFMELDMILKQARESRAKKKQREKIPSKSLEIEPRNDDDEEDKDNVSQEGCTERNGDDEDETSKVAEQVESELNCTVREDEETEDLQDTNDEEKDCKREEAGTERSDGGCDKEKVKQLSGNNNVVEDEVEVLEVEDLPKVAEIPAMKRAAAIKIGDARFGLGNVKSEDTSLEVEEDDKIASKAAAATRSKKKEIEPRNDVVEEDKDNEAQEGCTERSDDEEDETSKMVEQVETELIMSTIGEKDLNRSVRVDGGTENLQDNERDGKNEKAETERSDGGCDEEEVKQVSGNNNVENEVEVDLSKMMLGEWFDFMEVHLRKQSVDETEKMIETMRSKAQKVSSHIAEQKQAKGKKHEI